MRFNGLIMSRSRTLTVRGIYTKLKNEHSQCIMNMRLSLLGFADDLDKLRERYLTFASMGKLWQMSAKA